MKEKYFFSCIIKNPKLTFLPLIYRFIRKDPAKEKFSMRKNNILRGGSVPDWGPINSAAEKLPDQNCQLQVDIFGNEYTILLKICVSLVIF